VGLLRGSFRPTEAIVALRAYLRHRQTLIESAGLVVSDITGVTGLRILRAIVSVESKGEV
jgi:hypothetical protein